MSALQLLVEAAGWGGALLILSAYLLLSMEKVTGQSLLYQGMNVVGAAGFVVNGWWHGAIPSASLNVIWMLIGVIALMRIARRRRTEGFLHDRITSARARPPQDWRRL
ncbi:MAG: CBU_0592 family membrane protein [Allosphingosinicella sp.]